MYDFFLYYQKLFDIFTQKNQHLFVVTFKLY